MALLLITGDQGEKMKNNYSVHKPLSFLMLLFKFILLSFFFCLYIFSMAGLVFFVLMLLFMYILLLFSLSISFDMSFFLFLFLFVILKFFPKSLSFYHITVCPSLCYSFSFIIFFLFLLYHFLVFYVSICYSLFPSYVHYSKYFFHFSLYLSYSFHFRFSLKRNNYTDSEINTIVFHLVPLITRDQQWCACRAYPVFSVARSANSASSCYAIAICSEPKFTKNVKSYRYRCVCQKKKYNNNNKIKTSKNTIHKNL